MGCSLALISSIYCTYGGALEGVMSIAKLSCFCWIPLLSAPATFLSHEATDCCMQNLMSQSNSWRGDSCHTPVARCVRMAASASVTKWDAASYGLWFLQCAVCLEPDWGQTVSVKFLRVWGNISEDLLQGVTEGHHDTVIQICDTKYFSVPNSLMVLGDWDASMTDGSGVFHLVLMLVDLQGKVPDVLVFSSCLCR